MLEDHILIAHSRLRRARYRMSAFGTAAVVGIASLIASPVTSSAQVPAASGATGANVHVTAASTAKPPVFAYYYLWWSANHWRSALGSNYPTGASPMPLPATLDSTGCGARSSYAGNTLTDVPSRIYSQDDSGFIEADVRQAAAAGLSGFMVNWIGTGSATQSATSNPYSARLRVLVDAVHKVNAAGIPFKLWLSYKASAQVLPASFISNDLAYFVRTYGSDPAFDRSQSPKVTMIWQGSRKYSAATLSSVGAPLRSKLRILGDETSWSTSRAPYLDGNAYYWSSQNPYSNPQSFQQLAALAAAVRASGANPDGTSKVWVAPITPGYNKQLSGGSSCVPRRGGQTTHPNAFGLISWNEISEGSYIDPMTRYGYQDLNVLSSLIK
jgi:hypothetical protein